MAARQILPKAALRRRRSGFDDDQHRYAEPERATTTRITDFALNSSFDLLEHQRYRLF